MRLSRRYQFFKETKLQSSQFCISVKENMESQLEATIWTTAEMRKDCMRYSDCMFIDMRKASMNNIGWCCFAPVVNGNKIWFVWWPNAYVVWRVVQCTLRVLTALEV